MGETFLDRHGIKSGIKLNDVIEEFKYVYKGQTIKAGDFVNYINGVASKVDYGESVDTAIDSTNAQSGTFISAIALDNDRVFIAHPNGSDSGSYKYYLYGIVVMINGNTITCGIDTQLSTKAYSSYAMSSVLLPNGDIFIAHNIGSSRNYLHGIVVSISGTTIIAGEDTEIVGNIDKIGYAISACLLPNGDVFIAHSYGSKYHLYGIVVSISGTLITVGADTQLSSSAYTGYIISSCLLPNGDVFIAHSYSSNYHLYGIVVSIDGTTITKGSDTAIVSSSDTGRIISTCALGNGNVFIAHSYESNYYLYGIICFISGTAITKGADTVLENGGYEASNISAIALGEDKVFLAHCHLADASRLWAAICTINNTLITIGNDLRLSDVRGSGNVISSILLDNGTIFIAHNYDDTDKYLYAQILGIDYENNIPTNNISITEYEEQVTPATLPPFNAIALSSGVGGTDTEHNEQVKIARVYKEVTAIVEGNIFPIRWIDGEVIAGTKYTSNGYTIEASSSRIADTTEGVNNACDDSNGGWNSKGSTEQEWAKMTCPKPIKITEMLTWVTAYGNTDGFVKAIIQGSKDGDSWVDLHTISTYQTEMTKVTLENTDYYTYYRIVVYIAYFNANIGAQIKRWHTSKYETTEVIQ